MELDDQDNPENNQSSEKKRGSHDSKTKKRKR